jgi:hypothetical protein
MARGAGRAEGTGLATQPAGADRLGEAPRGLRRTLGAWVGTGQLSQSRFEERPKRLAASHWASLTLFRAEIESGLLRY